MLAERLERHDVPVWLVNTGWTGGPFGVGSRMAIDHTRVMVRAALNGELAGVPYETDPIFGVEVPTEVPGVPSSILRPRDTWADPDAYDAKARELAAMFAENFEDYADGLPPEIRQAGPRVEPSHAARRERPLPSDEAPTD
jgi:phosphoenolpyruvate carboxykinase (ATP)